MGKSAGREMKLAELSELSGIPARTIRLYIANDLIPGPLRAGRKAAYGPEHLETLKVVKQLQKEGLTLGQIRQRLGQGKGEPVLPQPVGWWKYNLANDVVVSVRGDASPWRIRKISQALKAMQELLGAEAEGREEEVEP